MTLEKPYQGSTAGLHRMLDNVDTAVQLVHWYTPHDDRHHDTFGALRTGVDYWPSRIPADRGEKIRFINSPETIAILWPDAWSYEWDDDEHTAVIARRRARPDGNMLTLLLHQPNILAANWSEAIINDRIEND